MIASRLGPTGELRVSLINGQCCSVFSGPKVDFLAHWRESHPSSGFLASIWMADFISCWMFITDGTCSSLGIVCPGGVKLIRSVALIDRSIGFAVAVGPELLLLFCGVGNFNGKDACQGLIVGELAWALGPTGGW